MSLCSFFLVNGCQHRADESREGAPLCKKCWAEVDKRVAREMPAARVVKFGAADPLEVLMGASAGVLRAKASPRLTPSAPGSMSIH
jgi:hypothetical protein